MPRTPMALLSPADQARLRALRRIKAVALGALIFMAVVFVILGVAMVSELYRMGVM